jgi:hypothetical protein
MSQAIVTMLVLSSVNAEDAPRDYGYVAAASAIIYETSWHRSNPESAGDAGGRDLKLAGTTIPKNNAVNGYDQAPTGDTIPAEHRFFFNITLHDLL